MIDTCSILSGLTGDSFFVYDATLNGCISGPFRLKSDAVSWANSHGLKVIYEL